MKAGLLAALMLVVGLFLGVEAGYVMRPAPQTTSITFTKTVTTATTATPFGVEGVEIDLVAKVYKVVDGDTFDAFPSGRVRLAI